MPKSFDKRDLAPVLSLLGSNAWIYFVAALINAAVLGFSFNLVLAFIQKDVLDAAVSGQQQLLTRGLVLAAVTYFTGVPLLIGGSYVIALFEKKALTRARLQTFRQIVDLPISHFDKGHSGDLISRTTNDLQTLGEIYTRLFPDLLFGLTLGLVGIVSILLLNWQIGIFALVLGLLTTWVSTVMAEPLRKKSTRIQESLSLLTQRLSDILQSLPVTKMFHLEGTIHQLYTQVNQQSTLATIDRAHTQALYDAINTFINWLRSIGTLVLGLYLMSNGQVALGIIVAAIHLQGNASYLFENLGDFITGIQRSLAGSTRVFELLAWPTEDTNLRPRALPDPDTAIAPTVPMIQLHELSFRFAASDPSVETGERANLLDRINLSVPKGQVAALVGPSGSGKSTLVKILMGLYPVSDGMLTVNGRPLSAYPLEELRDLMAYVPQDAYLFDGTIEENIRYGKPDASAEEVIAAARAVHTHDFIVEQPEGYQTLVGERGAKLSGGQRQRIAIARALLKDAPILLLDEATSALDSESEALVQKALETLMQGRTTIAIAHRLSTIQHADAIYVMQAGQVIEQGTHEALLKRGGLYKELYTLQEATGNQV